MFNAWLEFLVYQLPVACLMLIVVWKFIAHIDKRDASWLETVRNIQSRFIEELDKHEGKDADIHRETIDALRHNATVLHEASKVMERVNDQLRSDEVRRSFREQARQGG